MKIWALSACFPVQSSFSNLVSHSLLGIVPMAMGNSHNPASTQTISINDCVDMIKISLISSWFQHSSKLGGSPRCRTKFSPFTSHFRIIYQIPWAAIAAELSPPPVSLRKLLHRMQGHRPPPQSRDPARLGPEGLSQTFLWFSCKNSTNILIYIFHDKNMPRHESDRE